MTGSEHALVAEGPWFDELGVGDVFDGASGLTLTEGHAAAHQAIVGDRLRVALDHELSRGLTGRDRPLASPALVWDVAIGQSTSVTQHVVANLFYRGLAFRRMPSLGDTLRTRTEVVALKQNTRRPDRPATGLAALRITTTDQEGREVLDFWRCAMLPFRDPDTDTDHSADLARVGATEADGREAVAGWRLDDALSSYPSRRDQELQAGQTWEVSGGDVVSAAPELARLTLNIASAHHDATGTSSGRLVYGGHTIGLALSQAVRAIPHLLTVLSWRHCDHLGPVREGDTLTSHVEVEGVEWLAAGRLVSLRSRVAARATAEEKPRDVLDWRFLALAP